MLLRFATTLTFLHVFHFCLISGQTENENLVVNITQGPVSGVLSKNGEYYSFLGIPYGTVNATNRFKEAFEPPTWTEVREPVDVFCPQGNEAVSEDCLVVNVFIPRKPKSQTLPVMVDIHGGAFLGGRPAKSVDYIIPHGIVVVTITYRVGMFGFLCLGSENITGNAGLKDQVHAFRWVQDNIENFGGDPNAVTITGVSAGSASVDLHMVSPMSRGLFRAAIAESGVSTAMWSVNRKSVALAKRAAAYLGSKSSNINETERAFYAASTEDILAATRKSANPNKYVLFSACVENPNGTGEVFLPKLPEDILRAREETVVPKIMGFNSKEGMFMLPANVDDETLLEIDSDFSSYLPSDLKFSKDSDKEELAKRVKQFYFGKHPISVKRVNKLIDYWTDVMFLWPLVKRVGLGSTNASETYLYEFLYDGNLNAVKIPKNLTYPGATHGDERGYIMKLPESISNNATKEDMEMQHKFTAMWTDFIKYRNPTPGASAGHAVSWKPYSAKDQRFMKIDLPLKLSKRPMKGKALRFWSEVYDQHGTVQPDTETNSGVKDTATNSPSV